VANWKLKVKSPDRNIIFKEGYGRKLEAHMYFNEYELIFINPIDFHFFILIKMSTTTTTQLPVAATATSSSNLFDSIFRPVYTKLTGVFVFPFLTGVFGALGEYSVRFLYSKVYRSAPSSSTKKYDPLETFVTNGGPLIRMKRTQH